MTQKEVVIKAVKSKLKPTKLRQPQDLTFSGNANPTAWAWETNNTRRFSGCHEGQ